MRQEWPFLPLPTPNQFLNVTIHYFFSHKVLIHQGALLREWRIFLITSWLQPGKHSQSRERPSRAQQIKCMEMYIWRNESAIGGGESRDAFPRRGKTDVHQWHNECVVEAHVTLQMHKLPFFRGLGWVSLLFQFRVEKRHLHGADSLVSHEATSLSSDPQHWLAHLCDCLTCYCKQFQSSHRQEWRS